MKLRYQLIQAGLLSRMIESVRWAKYFILKLTPERVFLIAPDKHPDAPHTPLVFGNVASNLLFGTQYKIESLDRNTIALKISVDYWVRAIGKTANQAIDISCRLTKRQNLPNLAVQCQFLSSTGGPNVSLTHDIPVELIHSATLLVEPTWRVIEAHVMLPPLKAVKKMVDRMKKLSTRLTLACDMKGNLKFRVETDTVQVTTHYSDLVHPRLAANLGQQEYRQPAQTPAIEGAEEWITATVDIRAFIKFLQCQNLAVRDIVCCLSRERGLLMYAYIGHPALVEADHIAGVMSYHIPACSDPSIA